jgi:hypothetical protein
MELVSEPDLYSPSISDNGNYIDKIPSFNNLKNGLRCPCGARKDKTYDTHSIFSNHIKTKCHQNWLNTLNLNKANYYIENEQLKETLHNQRIIIGKLEKDVQNKIMTIDYLTLQINKVSLNNKVDINLIDFDD